MELLPRVAITMGDPAGVGAEVIARSFLEPEWSRVCRALVIGDAAFLQSISRRFAPLLSVHPVSSVKQARFQPGQLDVLDLGNVAEGLPRGQAGAEGGKASVEYIRKAVDLALRNEVEAITTAPINKESMHRAGHIFPGHTELLAELTGTKSVALMLIGEKLRVVLATTHVPLQTVASMISQDRVAETIRLTHAWLLQHVSDTPQIAVTGLNPHAGDGGIFGKEEQEIILPAIEETQQEGIQASGPFSADSLFSRTHLDKFDAVVTMYHDQGMIPVKMESRGAAVNITLGLPIIRTSVDHGTAFDIAGTGQASPKSLIAAVKAAASLSKTPLTLQ